MTTYDMHDQFDVLGEIEWHVFVTDQGLGVHSEERPIHGGCPYRRWDLESRVVLVASTLPLAPFLA